VISVIVCSIDPAKFQNVERQYKRLFANERFELIGIHDAKSLAEGYNRGIDRSKGDVLVFSHDDIEFLTPLLAERLRAHLSTFDLIGVAGASYAAPGAWHAAGPPFVFGQIAHVEGTGYSVFNLAAPAPAVPDIQVMDGVFLACRRSVVDKHRFDAVTFDGFHGYDVDFTFGAYLAGFKLAVCTDIPMIHASSGNFDARWEVFNRRYSDKYAGRFTRPAAPQYRLAAVSVPNKEEAIRRLTPWYASPAREPAAAAPPEPITTANIRVLFIGKEHDVPYETAHCARLNGLFSRIATFKPDVIVTTDAVPASLNVAPFEIRKKWVAVSSDTTTAQLIHAIERCYKGRLWGHRNRHLHPLVSVFTGVFNTGDFLRDTYQSLREQSYDNWEWIVVDDGSSDGTWERVLAIAAEDSRVRPFRTAHSGRIGDVKDIATRLATGVYLVELDHDDMLTDDALAEIKDAFEANPDVGMVYSNFAEFFQDGRPHRYPGDFWASRYRETQYRGKKYLECRTPDIYGAFGPDTTDQFAWYLTVGPNHVRAFRTDELRRLGGYNRELPVADDWDLTARFFLRSKICHIDKLLYLYRFLDSGGNTTFVRNKSIQDHLRLARERYVEEFEQVNAKRLARKRAVTLGARSTRRSSETRNVLVTAIYGELARPGEALPRWPSQRLAKAEMVLGLDQDIVFFVPPELERGIIEAREARGLLERTRIVAGPIEDAPGYRRAHDLVAAGKPAAGRSVAETAAGWSKLWMLRRAMARDPFGGTHFSWIDFYIGVRASTAHVEDDGVLTKPADKIQVLLVEDPIGPLGFRAAPGYVSASKIAMARLCRQLSLRARKERTTLTDEELLTNLVAERPELFDVYYGTDAETFDNRSALRRNPASLIAQMRRFRALRDFARSCDIGARVLESHRRGALTASPRELSTLLDEYFIAAYYRHEPDQALAQSIAVYYVDLANRDPKFFAAFLLDHEHIRNNFGFLREPVL
jgi:glycosyltransferase involved in cell wall biosynthesis